MCIRDRSVPGAVHIAWLGAVMITTAVVTGCGGAGSDGGSGGGGGNTQIPDMGTLTAASDNAEYSLENAASSLVLGIAGQSQTAGASVAQESNTGSADSLWHFLPMNNNQFNAENMLTHQVMGVQGAYLSLIHI